MTPARALAIIITACLIGAALLFYVATAHAQAVCGLRVEIEKMTAHYDEKLVAVMSIGEARVPTEIYANLKTGSWTIIYLPDAEHACVGRIGKDFALTPSGDPA